MQLLLRLGIESLDGSLYGSVRNNPQHCKSVPFQALRINLLIEPFWNDDPVIPTIKSNKRLTFLYKNMINPNTFKLANNNTFILGN